MITSSKVLRNIKEYRNLRGYSCDYMGIQLEIKEAGYRKIENGTTKIAFETVLAIAKILKVPVELLLSEHPISEFDFEKNSESKRFKEFYKFYEDYKNISEKYISQLEAKNKELLEKVLFLEGNCQFSVISE